jgi:hypothetical protein
MTSSHRSQLAASGSQTPKVSSDVKWYQEPEY